MLKRSILGLGLCSVICGSVLAQDNLEPVQLDDIRDLPSVEALTLDEENDALFIVTENELRRWELFPLQETHSVPVDLLASDMRLGPLGDLFVVGLRWNAETLKYLGGSINRYVFRDQGAPESFLLYTVANKTDEAKNVGIGQFSSVDFAADGRAFVASPVSFAVSIFPPNAGALTGPTLVDRLQLKCGASNKVSIVEIEDVHYYFSTTTTGAVLEYGPLALARSIGQDNCFRVANVFSQNEEPTTSNPVLHQIIDFPITDAGRQTGKAILALEPNINRLFLFEIERSNEGIRISRGASQDLDLADPSFELSGPQSGVYSFLETSQDGSTILVSGPSHQRILRFSIGEEGLEFENEINTGGLVRRLTVGPTGKYALFVTGASFLGGDQTVTLIADPAALKRELNLPPQRFTVRSIQQTLNEAGFDAGAEDGILGDVTNAAIEEYFKVQAEIENLPTPSANTTTETQSSPSVPQVVNPAPSATRSLPTSEGHRKVSKFIRGVFSQGFVSN
ncbi:MAG: peptidoglycan-binding domain-containing protein [Pseudomonadota bacterium]